MEKTNKKMILITFNVSITQEDLDRLVECFTDLLSNDSHEIKEYESEYQALSDEVDNWGEFLPRREFI